jgi:uncharacterized RDD family membrane protein YckC
MNCSYCGSPNTEFDHRCVRCGRRMYLAAPKDQSGPKVPAGSLPFSGRLAVAAMPVAEPPFPVSTPKPEPVRPPAEPKQGVLFGPGRDLRVVERVVQMPPPAHKEALTRAAGVRRPIAPVRPQNQQRLFSPSAPDTGIAESTIYCEAPVAMPVHRLMAAALDGSMVLISLGIFLSIFYLAGGKVVLNKMTLPFYIGAMLTTLTLYRGLWCMANTDSIGMRWSGLMLVTFDGEIPTPKHRWYRMVGSYISSAAGALGVLWCLVDEEKLTWHDHMSKTFPTPRARVLKYSKR